MIWGMLRQKPGLWWRRESWREGMYKGGQFKFTFNINPNYPHEPPKVLCTQKVCIPHQWSHLIGTKEEMTDKKIYHPNLDLSGNICLWVASTRDGMEVVLMYRNILREDWKPVSFPPYHPYLASEREGVLRSGIESRRSNGRTSISVPRTVCLLSFFLCWNQADCQKPRWSPQQRYATISDREEQVGYWTGTDSRRGKWSRQEPRCVHSECQDFNEGWKCQGRDFR
jgi:hypothetical protein